MEEDKKVEVTLNYNNKGTMEEKIIPITFVCNDVIERFQSITDQTKVIQETWDEVKEIQSRISEEGRTPDMIKEDAKLLKENENKILKFNTKNFFKERFELLQIVLEDNGCEDELLLEYDFWNRKVEPGEIINFLTKCVYKDASKKKALVEL